MTDVLARADHRPAIDDLLVAVGRGDRRAFAQLYDELAPTVVGLARSVVRDPDLAAEVAQDVFLEVWRIANRFDAGRGSARTWVTTITHRRAIDRVRREQSERDRRRRDDTMAQAADADPTAVSVADRSEWDGVVVALAGLETRQREAITLAYFDGHTYSQVAAILGLPVGTVKSRIRDGLRRMRPALADARPISVA